MRPPFKAAVISALIYTVVIFGFKYLIDQPHGIQILKEFSISLIGGVLYGFFFGFLSIWSVNSSAVKYLNADELLKENEVIIYKTAVNYFTGAEAAGGMLFLTKQNLIFKPHKYNYTKKAVIIPINDIQDLKAIRTFLLANNGLQILRKSGKKEKFVVEGRDKLLQFLRI